MRKFIIPAVAAVLLGLGITASTSAGATAEPVPSCHSATFSENSGQGPTYKHVHFCDALKAGVNNLIVDGGPLKSGATVFGSHVTASPATKAASLTGASPIAGCWNHNGIQASGLIMYECISQPSGLGGALYWSANEADFNWDKHPGSGLLWVEASTLRPTSDSNPVNTYQDFWTGIALPGGAFCTVINPGYDQHPTQCEVNGKIKTMDARRQASYDQFAAAMVATNVPDCAWSMTVQPDEAQCDIDS